VAEDHDNQITSRPPTLDDLLQICQSLNEHGARYVLLGGMAIIEYGLARLTQDIDLLVAVDTANLVSVKAALRCLPDKAIDELAPDDLAKYVVVRVNDVVTVDLMAAACGITYEQAAAQIEWHEVRGVRLPLASPELLLRTKATYREKDALDRAYLQRLLAERQRK
jgi:predicted nucleotidyltransferase